MTLPWAPYVERASLLALLVQGSDEVHLRSAVANAYSSADTDPPMALCGVVGYCTVLRYAELITCDACRVEYVAARLRADDNT